MLDVDLSKVNELKKSCISDGYLWDEEMQMPMHRAVAVRLGVTLYEGNEVHHINHHRKDNRPANLIVLRHVGHLMVHASASYLYFECGNLREPETLTLTLKDAGMWYDYLGDRDRSKGEQTTRNKETT